MPISESGSVTVSIREVKVTTRQPLHLAVASLKSAINWTWHLKVDETGLYRWYLDGAMRTQLRGCTRTQAEDSLRRFVEQSLRGDLEIVNTPERIAVEHETGPAGQPLKETG